MTVLNICTCTEITDEGVIGIANGCPQLRRLEMVWCPKITDASLLALAQNCKGMELLNLWRCPQVTDAGLVPLCQARLYGMLAAVRGVRCLSARGAL